MTNTTPCSTFPAIIAQFSSEDLVIGAGVAIFHIASQRVVICSARDRYGRKYYFLPKGRRDAGEESGRGAEREGYEESGYRNRLLPLSLKHRQPQAYPRVQTPPLTAEPVWMQMLPMDYGSRQYIIYWYIAETLPPDLEEELERKAGEAYKPPPSFPHDLKLRDRIKMEPKDYEPMHHEGTGVDAEEQTYESHLLPVGEAVEKLGKNGIMADVVLRGWKGIQERFAAEGFVDDENA
ncbi:uncharacterized protein BDR25DRAFT_300121 [Lindgomyces ingoldianus]|uniref:Uncharacterized protein n=1 Tax=Lindgomyces ingoldianus TaxID=673940 RepID=A0ACB6RCW1_9PLEO|nr:uncharacterized protein BDR25DRAFT_300121 [Lindgomyces ingoldianus]KAF2477031.1 hypothetical protein BDR25DRAFT_300121 [Lindgomyces ingoldianus]